MLPLTASSGVSTWLAGLAFADLRLDVALLARVAFAVLVFAVFALTFVVFVDAALAVFALVFVAFVDVVLALVVLALVVLALVDLAAFVEEDVREDVSAGFLDEGMGRDVSRRRAQGQRNISS